MKAKARAPWSAAARALAEADGTIRRRGGPGGALKTATAYLLGLLAIRFAANSYLMFGPLSSLASPADAAALAWISACLACLPLAAATALTEAPNGLSRRLSLSPVGPAARLSVGVLAPAAARLPITAIAAALPAVAAAPLLSESPAAYAATLATTVACAVSAAVSLKALAGIAYALSFRRIVAARRGRRGNGAHAAFAASLAILAASNPTAAYGGGRAGLTVFGSAAEFPDTLVPAFIDGAAGTGGAHPGPGAELEFGAWPSTSPAASAAALAIGVAALVLAAAALSALEAAVAGRVGTKARAAPKRIRRSGRSRSRTWSSAIAIVGAVEAHDRAGPAFIASLALAVAAIAQDARPLIPAAMGIALAVARLWRAFVGIAVDSITARRLALIPSARGRAELQWLVAQAALAVATASPLIAAALVSL